MDALPPDPEEELCELLRQKFAGAIPAELMADFQLWVSLEQSLAYARGRRDEERHRDQPEQFTFEPSAAGR